jgi:hypothetical protein
VVSALLGQTGCGVAPGNDDAGAGAHQTNTTCAGCAGGSSLAGGGGSANSAAHSAVAAGISGASPAAAPARAEDVHVAKSFWRAGWMVKLGDAHLKVESGSSVGTVTIDAHFENLGTAAAEFNSALLLTDGRNDDMMHADGDLSNVSGGRAKDVSLVAQVDPDFGFDEATLIAGDPANNLSVVPIGSQSPDDLISMEPLELDVSGPLAVGGVRFDLGSGSIRADDVAQHDELDKDHLLLSVGFSVTRTGYLGSAEQFVSASDNLQLRTPDGTLVAPYGDAPWSDLLSQTGSTIDALVVEFAVPKPAAGNYALIAKGNWGTDDTNGNDWVEGEFPFEVPTLKNFADE